MVAKLVGLKSFTSKKGNTCHCINVVIPYSPSDNARGFFGSDAKTEFVDTSVFESLSNKDIGKDIDLEYSISYGRAFLNGVKVL